MQFTHSFSYLGVAHAIKWEDAFSKDSDYSSHVEISQHVDWSVTKNFQLKQRHAQPWVPCSRSLLFLIGLTPPFKKIVKS